MNSKVLPDITYKQQEIINLVFYLRFINRHQLQALFGLSDPSRLNKLLKDLVEKKYLGRIYSKKLLENTKPSIYYLENNGIIWNRVDKGYKYKDPNENLDFKYIKKFYEDSNASLRFINHSQAIFDFYIQFKEKEKKIKNLGYVFEAKTELWIRTQLVLDKNEDFNEYRELIPDVYIERTIEKNGDVAKKTFFIILFDPGVPGYAIRYKIDQYIKAFEENDGKEIPGLGIDYPTLQLIFPNLLKLNQMGKYIKTQFDEKYVTNMTILLTTLSKAVTDGITNGKIWQILMAD